MKKVFYALLLTVFVLTMSVGNADAAWTTGFSTAKKILSNAGTAKPLTAVSAANKIYYLLGAGQTLNTNDVVNVTLTGGAKFSTTAPVMAGSGAGFTIVGSPTGGTSANFRVAGVQLVGNCINLNSDSVIFDASAINGSVDVCIYAYTSVGSLPIIGTSASAPSCQSTKTPAVYAFSTASAMESVYIAASTNVADVSATTGAYKKFVGASVTGTAATFSYKNLSENINTLPSGQQISAGKVIFNVAGTLTGVTSVSGTGCTGSNSAGTQGSGVANFFLIDTAKTNAYCYNTAAIAPQAIVALAPVFIIDGTTAQAARSFTAAFNFLADSTKWNAHASSSAATVYSITRNGSSFVTNSVGARNTIKITDRSGSIAAGGGSISISAWDASGTPLTVVSDAPALTVVSNGTTIITGADLIARFSGSPMKYEFSVETPSVIVTNAKANADATMTVTTIFNSTTTPLSDSANNVQFGSQTGGI